MRCPRSDSSRGSAPDYDTVDTDACAERGVWVSNSPDYGVGEVATHALAMALALIRHLPFYDRDIRAGTWHFESAGKVRRCSEMTLGIVGLGRIGKRMAYLSRNLFKRMIACDPYLIDGDFPAYVERVGLDEAFAAERRRQPAHAAQRRDARDGRREALVADASGQLPGQHIARRCRRRRCAGRRAWPAGASTAPESTCCRRSRSPPTIRSPAIRACCCRRMPRSIRSKSERDLRRKSAQNIVTWVAHRAARLHRRRGNEVPPN